jgi:hypothetical protein
MEFIDQYGKDASPYVTDFVIKMKKALNAG